MKGRGVWLVDMIGSELIRYCFHLLLLFCPEFTICNAAARSSAKEIVSSPPDCPLSAPSCLFMTLSNRLLPSPRLNFGSKDENFRLAATVTLSFLSWIMTNRPQLWPVHRAATPARRSSVLCQSFGTRLFPSSPRTKLLFQGA
jgi:hypothetical protein